MISRKLLSKDYLSLSYPFLSEALSCFQESYLEELPENNPQSLGLQTLLYKEELLFCLSIYQNPNDLKKSNAQTIFFSFDWTKDHSELDEEDAKKIESILQENIDFMGSVLELYLKEKKTEQILNWEKNETKKSVVFIKTERINMILYLMADNLLKGSS